MDNKAATLAKARAELEEMYSGIPDDSADLTFQHLANLKNSPDNFGNINQKKTNAKTTVDDQQQNNKKAPPMKIPSIDFSKSLQATNQNYHYHNNNHRLDHPLSLQYHHDNQYNIGYQGRGDGDRHDQHSIISSHNNNKNIIGDHSMMSERRRRRPGIPHSKICTLCSTYTYIFRHRCLVCGRVYCRQCVRIGMGEMREGRKCVECLGRRFSQRYIQRAGEVGCFCARYPSVVRQAEVKWAEKGPRRSGEREYGPSGLISRSKSPVGPRTPNGIHASSGPNSFVMSSSYSPYTPSHHHYPF